MLNRTLLAFVFGLSSAMVWAAEPSAPPAGSAAAAPAAGSKTEEYRKINTEWNELIGKLGALKNEYATATDSARKAEIRKQYYGPDGIEKAQAMEVKLIAAAESAYTEAPNADPEITAMLAATLYDYVGHDDYEPAFKLGKTLMDNKCTEKYVPALAGVAAYCVNEYDLAGPWLKAARESGMLSKISNELKTPDGPRPYAYFPDMIDGAKEAWAKEKKIRDAEDKAGDLPRVLLKTTAGDIELELFENEAPNTVLNFITLVEKGFYNGLKFHRVLPAFMAQGGDPKGDGSGGPGYTIPCECYQANFRQHFRGSLSMAHAGPDTGGSQFFLTFLPTPHSTSRQTSRGQSVPPYRVRPRRERLRRACQDQAAEPPRRDGWRGRHDHRGQGHAQAVASL